jgi:2-polyprenyl-6-methoxyphenol hydroxylase-like FAD-dependent oxidoreductase
VDTDVLVVGAGPTGLMLATQLARLGVRPMIIDRHAGPALESRALGVQARTLEIYARLGIADAAIEAGRKATGASMWAEGRHAARVPLGDIGQDMSPYPFLLILGQDANEQLLGAELNRNDVFVRWHHELVGLVEDASGVTASVRTHDGSTQEIRARWVAGCDGARSAVRDINDIPFVGAPYEQVFFVADARATGTMKPGELNVYLWMNGFHLFFPMRRTDHWRVVGILPPELRDRNGIAFDDVVPSILADAGTALTFHACSWFSTYRIHHRRAERFRRGRCFLLGDAAHIHSPVGAQGMNTGLQDAWNLAWKLAFVLQGKAGPAILDTYEAERLPVAKRLLRTTDRAFSAIVSGSAVVGAIRTRLMPRLLAAAMHQDRIRKLVFRTISQTGIRYPGSPLSGAAADVPKGGPRPGDRLPWLRLRFEQGGPAESVFDLLDDRHFNLLVFGTNSTPVGLDGVRLLVPLDEAANTAELDRVGIARPSYYLVRPDGHIGLAGGALDPALVRGYLERLGSV